MGKLKVLIKKVFKFPFKAFGKVARILIFIRLSGNKSLLNKVSLDLKSTLKKASISTDCIWIVNINNYDTILSFKSLFDVSSIIILTKIVNIDSTKIACKKAGFNESDLDMYITDYEETSNNNFQINSAAKALKIDIVSSMIFPHHIVGLDGTSSNPEKILRFYHFFLKTDIIMISFNIYDFNFNSKLQKANRFLIENDFKLLKINRSDRFIKTGLLIFIFIKEDSSVDNFLFKLPTQ